MEKFISSGQTDYNTNIMAHVPEGIKTDQFFLDIVQMDPKILLRIPRDRWTDEIVVYCKCILNDPLIK